MLTLLSALPCPAAAAESLDTSRTLYVGYLSSDGDANRPEQYLFEYARHYLDEIARYTDWQYVYLPIPPGKAIEALKSGQIDLYFPTEPAFTTSGFAISSGYPCYALLSLYGRKDDFPQEDAPTALADLTRMPQQLPSPHGIAPAALTGKRIGYLRDTWQADELSRFLEEQAIMASPRAYANDDELVDAFARGEIDCFLDNGNRVPKNARHLFPLSIHYAQFAALPENASLIQQLTDTVLTIETIDPGFESQLDRRFYDAAQAQLIRYTPDELAYMAQAAPLRIAYSGLLAPYAEVDDKNREGILPDILSIVHDMTGISFDYVPAGKTPPKELVERGQADAFFCVYSNTSWAQPFRFTNAVIKISFSYITRRKGERIEHPRVIVLDWSYGTAEYLASEHPDWITTVNIDPEECLRAVERDEADIALLPSLYIQRSNPLSNHPSLAVDGGKILDLPISLAISRNYPGNPLALRRR
ncbi:hypothetical protein [uncultured Selenomonas sp.]|uniref:hypothetical protein n=1 Tax=uncultured Selenomonas sp. TaxID=159275 RepID=UPI002583149E|nr:hypothetical protein [uncultured Selenomonas sp.]